jgi:hypothetical protein
MPIEAVIASKSLHYIKLLSKIERTSEKFTNLIML